MFKLRWFIALTLMVSSLFIFIESSFAQINIKPSSVSYRDIQFEAFRGLPRLGEQNTSGIIRHNNHNSQNQNRINNNKNKAEKIGKRIAKHNYSLGLLSRLDFMNKNPECFKNMNGYDVRIESCAGFVINHESQKSFWKKYIENMAFFLTEKSHSTAFCKGEEICTARQLDRLYKRNLQGQTIKFDEFDKRDFVNDLMNSKYSSFEQARKKMDFPKEAYFVGIINLGDYDFDQKNFSFNLPLLSSIYSANNLIANTNNLNSRHMSLSTNYLPTLPFEKEFKNGSSIRYNVDLPMEAGKARNLSGVKGRGIYAVTHIKFINKVYDKDYDLLDDLQNPKIQYHYAENKVELFSDEALSQKIAEVYITNIKQQQVVDKKVLENKYTFDKNSKTLDWKSLSLLRFKKGNITKKDMDVIAYSITAGEKKLWVEHKQRVDYANKPIRSANSYDVQEKFRNQKKRAGDRAKLSSISWQDIDTLSEKQKKDFYNFMIGDKFHHNGELNWPESFSAVSWGMNLVTIFRKGYFPDAPNDILSPVDDETRKFIKDFLKDLANSQNLDNITIVYGLEGVTYNQDRKMLIISQNKGPFISIDNPGKNVAQEAKDRIIYPLITSDKGAAGIEPNVNYRNCYSNKKRKSKDCTTGSGSFLNINFPSAFLAFDKEIYLPDIPMEVTKATELLKHNSNNGWRLVVELNKPDMKVVKYKHTNPRNKKMIEKETQTLLANVKRVLLLSPNDDIVLSIIGDELTTAKEVTDAIKKQAQDTSKLHQELINNTQQQQNEYVLLKRCNDSNDNLMSMFNKCEDLRSVITKENVELENAQKNNCYIDKSISSDDTPMNVSDSCNSFANLPINEMNKTMKKCMLNACGDIPKTIIGITKYQTCMQNAAKDMAEKMSLALGSREINNKSTKTCKDHHDSIKTYMERLNNYKCVNYVDKPKLTDCSTAT
ncbi:MAG: hypothetical protein COA74_11835 [Gammaproteobacteria bacterium]|nr:MAG: hypothetical protein COA74_11835 [Gammaproteobacteria bacterium]